SRRPPASPSPAGQVAARLLHLHRDRERALAVYRRRRVPGLAIVHPREPPAQDRAVEGVPGHPERAGNGGAVEPDRGDPVLLGDNGVALERELAVARDRAGRGLSERRDRARETHDLDATPGNRTTVTALDSPEGEDAGGRVVDPVQALVRRLAL